MAAGPRRQPQEAHFLGTRTREWIEWARLPIPSLPSRPLAKTPACSRSQLTSWRRTLIWGQTPALVARAGKEAHWLKDSKPTLGRSSLYHSPLLLGFGDPLRPWIPFLEALMIQQLDFWDSQPDENAISESERSPNVNASFLTSLWAKMNNVTFLTSYYISGTDSLVG